MSVDVKLSVGQSVVQVHAMSVDSSVAQVVGHFPAQCADLVLRCLRTKFTVTYMTKKPNHIRKSRQEEIEDLEYHLWELSESLKRLDALPDTAKRIAGTLRLLVADSSRRDKGLLMRLMKQLGVIYQVVKNDKIVDVDEVEHESMDFVDFVNTAHAAFLEYKNRSHADVIKMIAQKAGSSHEDNKVPKALYDTLRTRAGEREAIAVLLTPIASETLEAGLKVLQSAYDQGDFNPRYCEVSKARLAYPRVAIGAVPKVRRREYMAEPGEIHKSGGLGMTIGGPPSDWFNNSKVVTWPPLEVPNFCMAIRKTPPNFLTVIGCRQADRLGGVFRVPLTGVVDKVLVRLMFTDTDVELLFGDNSIEKKPLKRVPEVGRKSSVQDDEE